METARTFNGPFPTATATTSPINSVDVARIDRGLYDLYDNDTGECLNEGCMFPFVPTKAEVAEFVLTGRIKGKIE